MDPPVKWEIISTVEDTPKTTLMSRVKKYAPSAEASSGKEAASENDDDEAGGGTYTHRDRDAVSKEND